MPHVITAIYVRQGLERIDEVRQFLAAHPECPVSTFASEKEIRVPGNSMAEKISHGKHVVVITKASVQMGDATHTPP